MSSLDGTIVFIKIQERPRLPAVSPETSSSLYVLSLIGMLALSQIFEFLEFRNSRESGPFSKCKTQNHMREHVSGKLGTRYFK